MPEGANKNEEIPIIIPEGGVMSIAEWKMYNDMDLTKQKFKVNLKGKSDEFFKVISKDGLGNIVIQPWSMDTGAYVASTEKTVDFREVTNLEKLSEDL